MAFNMAFSTNTSGYSREPSENLYNLNDEDPAAEFLEREKCELGDITTNANSSLLADPFNARSMNNSFLSNGASSPNMNVGGSYSPIPSRNSPYQALSDLNEQMNEPEKIRKWREEFTTRIARKDAEEEMKRKEMHEQAKKELDDFYKQRNEQLERLRGQNRSNNRMLEDDLFKSQNVSNSKASDWDKITSLCEFNPKTNRSQKDLTRYRSVLLQLKQQQTGAK